MEMNVYIKKYWKEENVLIYLHFIGEKAVRQIEIYPQLAVFLSEENPVYKTYFLYDQNFSDLELDSSDFITEYEFNKKWQYTNSK